MIPVGCHLQHPVNLHCMLLILCSLSHDNLSFERHKIQISPHLDISVEHTADEKVVGITSKQQLEHPVSNELVLARKIWCNGDALNQ